jgi:hypothetical protein
MIKLTEFTSVIDTYKKNFAIRSKRFDAKKKKDLAEEREEREKKIEAKKLFKLDNIKDKIGDKAGNILDTVIRFAGFTLLGVIVKNIDKITIALKSIVEKLKEFAQNVKVFFNEKVVPFLTDVFNLGKDIFKVFEGIGDFVIGMNPFKDFDSVFNTVINGILGIAFKLGNLYNPVKPGSLPPGSGGAATGTSLSPKQVAAREAAKAAAEEAKRTKALRDAANLRKQAEVARGSTRRRLLRQAKRLEKTVGGADTSSVATATADKPGQPGQRTPRLITKTFSKEFSDDLQASKAAADAAKPGPVASFRTFLKNALDRNFKEQRLANPSVTGITEDIARSNMFDDLAKEFADEFEGKKPFSTIGKEAPTAPRGNLIAPKLLKGIFGPEDLLNQKSLNLLKGLDFRFTLDDLARTFTFQNLKSTIKGGVAGFIIEFLAKSIAKGVSDSLPFSIDNQSLGFLVSDERIAKVRAQQLLRMNPKERETKLKQLNADAQSEPFFLDKVGNKNKKMAELILREYLKLTISEQSKTQIQTTSVDPKITQQTISPKKIESEMLIPGDYTPGELKQLEEIQQRFGSQSSVSKPSMVASVNRNMSNGLDGPTTYGNQGVMISREVIVAIQPVEKEVPAPAQA